MTDAVEVEWARAREQTLTLYFAVVLLLLLGVGILTAYTIQLGPIIGPGVESSFGYAVGLLFLIGALLAHIIDRAYRLYPLGRKVSTHPPGPVTDQSIANFVIVLVLVLGGAAVAYILGSLIA
ncbi:MAG: hypothetical protein L3K19_07770 [Thermoplasmata archaeon]|nr:hypothetical protein [Thermoplasmata archaeon]